MEKAMTCAATGMVLAMALSPSLPARAAVTNVVDVDALAAAAGAGLSETNGWTMSGVDTYADASLRINANADWLRSPTYDADIVGVVATVRRSEIVTRWLCVVNADNGAELARFATCAKKDTLEEQSLVFGIAAGARRIVFKFGDDASGNTGWGIGALSVLTAEPAVEPADLHVSRMGDDWCALSWVNGAGTVSNRVDAYQVERGKGEDVIFETGFDNFTGNQSANKLVSDDLPELLGSSFSGVNVYAQGATNGICLVGQTRSLGILRYAGLADYSGVTLKLSAKQYPKDNADTIVAYEAGGSTNAIATLTLTDEFVEYAVDLSKDANGNDVPNGAAILIGYYATPSNRRVLIDSLSIVRTGVDALRPLGFSWLPAPPGPVSFSTKGAFALPERAECRFDVFARNVDGLVSDASTVETRIGGVPGFRFILR